MEPTGPQRWRWLDLGAQGPFENAATMPVLVRSVAQHGAPVAQTSVWGATHLNVGWFDDVDSTLDLQRCEELGVLVVRRAFYGGGTVYYEAGSSMMWGFFLPHEDLDGLLRTFQPVVLDALARVGLGEVRFEGSSDLRWHGRKLGALTAQDVVGCVSVGGFLNLRRPDLSTYLRVVRIPDDKFKDKAVKDMTEYVCTAEEVAGAPVTYEQVRDALVAALAEAGIELVPGGLTEAEGEAVRKLSARAGSDVSVRRVSSSAFEADAPAGTAVGFGNHKGRKLCRAGVALSGDGTIAAALMAGDMHLSPPDVLDRMAAALVGGRPDEPGDLRARLAQVLDADDVTQADDVMGVTADDLLAAVLTAATAAEG